MILTPLMKRAQRLERNKSMVDLNLVALIDIFTILIFFLLANASEVDVLPNTKAIKLPQSVADRSPKATVVVMVNNEEIIVDGRRVASVAEVMNSGAEVIDALKSELAYQSTRTLINIDKKEAVTRDITIMGDKDIPYHLLKKIMLTCALANYSNISFAVMKK